jgi:hypothetical protein
MGGGAFPLKCSTLITAPCLMMSCFDWSSGARSLWSCWAGLSYLCHAEGGWNNTESSGGRRGGSVSSGLAYGVALRRLSSGAGGDRRSEQGTCAYYLRVLHISIPNSLAQALPSLSNTFDIDNVGISASRLITPLSRQSDLPSLFISLKVKDWTRHNLQACSSRQHPRNLTIGWLSRLCHQ